MTIRVPTSAADPTLQHLARSFPDCVQIVHPETGCPYAVVDPGHLRPVLAAVRRDPELRIDRLADLTAVDHLDGESTGLDSRFSLAYQLDSSTLPRELTLRVRIVADAPVAPSIIDLAPAARWAEREVYDLFGIDFEGNGDLRRLFLPEDYPGFPLRKDQPRAGAGERDRSFPPQRIEDRGSPGERTLVVGPAGPVTRGALRLWLRLCGDTVEAVDPEIGFSHCGIEKAAEGLTPRQVVTLMDRLADHVSLHGSLGFVRAVESLLGITPPPRAQAVRWVLGELGRISEHILCVCRQAQDAGAAHLASWALDQEERFRRFLDAMTGSRALTALPTLGGLSRDLPVSFTDATWVFLKETRMFLDFTRPRLLDSPELRRRLEGKGAIIAGDAVALGLTGPVLRACGVPRDSRRTSSWDEYEDVDFQVPVGRNGDAWDRLIQRLLEIDESLRIVEKRLARFPGGPTRVEVPEVRPETSSAAPIVGHGGDSDRSDTGRATRDTYVTTESPSGELGFFVVLDPGGSLYRLHVRPPSLYHVAALGSLLPGTPIDDVPAVLSSLHLVAGELDR